MIELKKSSGVSGEIEIDTDNTRLFKITPVFSGSESFGIAARVRDVFKSPFSGMETPINADGHATLLHKPLFTVRRMLSLPETRSVFNGYTPDAIDPQACLTNVMLRLKIEALIDARFNPFEDATGTNRKNEYEKFQGISEYNVSYILRIVDTNGKVKMHYANRYNDGSAHNDFYATQYVEMNGKWIDGDGVSNSKTTLRYYDRSGYTGWKGGWQSNNVGYRNSYVPKESAGDGDLIPIPPGCQGCVLELSILNFFGPVRSRGENPTPFIDFYPNWVLFKIPELTLVNSYGKAIDGNDIEYKSWLNSSAKEEKKIETIVGTPRTSANFGMGMLMDVSSRTTLSMFTRAGVTAPLEKLLIGTWYSNYSRRMNMLSGTVRLLDGFGTYTDANETDTYLMVSEVQDVQQDESNVKLAEIAPDNFEGVEYE